MSRARFWTLGAAILLLNAGGWFWVHHGLALSPKSKLRILTALPAVNVDQTDRFTLLFDEPLASSAQLLQPLERSPFVVLPRLDGHWQWAAPDRLEFLLSGPLPPGRRFTIQPAADAEVQTGRRLVGQTQFRFQTRPLELLCCRLTLVDRDHVNFELEFNQPVGPDDLLRCLTVRDGAGGAVLKSSVLNQQPSPKLVVRGNRPQGEGLSIVLDGRLTGHGAELPLGGEWRSELHVAKRFVLLRTDVQTPVLEKSLTVRLDFSHELNRTQKLPAIDVSPEVKGLVVSRSQSSLILQGQFECNRRYTATVPSTLLAADGQTLREEQRISFEVPDRSPCVMFPLRRGVLSPKGQLVVDVEAVNVGGLNLQAYRLHSNNLVAHLAGLSAGGTSRLVKTLPVKLDLPRNEPRKLSVDLKGLFGSDPLGVYRVGLQMQDTCWTCDQAIVTVTDLAITAKQHRDGFLVWVTSLSTGRPVESAKVSAVTRNNQVIATAATDAEGLAALAAPPNHPDGRPFVITAQSESDLSFIRPSEDAWELDDVDQGGRDIPTTYDVMLYAERGVYRPGETIHLTGIVRDAIGRIPPPMPMTISVYRPDGRRTLELPVRPESPGQGVFHAEVFTAGDDQTGYYRFTATLPGGKEVLGQLHVLVEAFVPVRMEVKGHPRSDRFGPGETPSAGISARYLFGSPAAGLPVSVQGGYKTVPFSSGKHKDYSFGDPSATEESKPPEVRTVLDDLGEAAVDLAPPTGRSKGLWRGRFSATVTEAGGRSVSANFSVLIDAIDLHVGLRAPPGRIVPVGEPLSVDWIVLTGLDEPAQVEKLQWRLCRVEWDWVVERVNNNPVWKTVERLILAASGDLAPEAPQGSLEVRCPEPGRYRLSLLDPASGAAAVAEFYAAHGSDQAAPVNRPERLELVLDQDKYQPGSTARLLVRSPFPGTMLLTVETDRVVDRRVVEMEGRQVRVDLPVPPELRGGAFVTATVVRAVDFGKEKWLPHRAMGMVRLKTDDAANRLPVAIVAPKKAQPGDRITVTVQTDAPVSSHVPGVVHLWAVDEGILLTTDHRTPDPLGHFLAMRKLGVSTADLYGDLLPDYKRPADITRIGAGDDSAADMELRHSPVPIRTRQSAVVWNQALPVGPDGKVEVALDLPRLAGEMRLMAVAVDHDRYGSAQQALTVCSPLMVEVASPRFAAPGDSFRVPIKVFNTTETPVTARVSLKTTGPIEVMLDGRLAEMNQEYRQWSASRYPRPTTQPATGPATEPASHPVPVPVAEAPGQEPAPTIAVDRPGQIPPGKSAIVWIEAQARDPGPVRVEVSASAEAPDGAKLTADCEAEFSVRPTTPLTAQARLMKVEAGRPLRIDPPDGFLARRTTISISGRPDVQLRPAIEQLLDYPYGCVEQTTSRLYGILYAPELLSADGEGDSRAKVAGEMVASGILRLWSMQTSEGGLGYWPGDRYPNVWGTAYAASLLVRAKKAGYAIDKRFTGPLVGYIEKVLKDIGDSDLDDNTRALLCDVLAAFDSPPQGWMNRLGDRPDKLDIAGRAHLAAAWLEAGRKDLAAAALPEDTIGLAVRTATGGRITSQTAQYGVLLDVLLDMDPQHPWIPMLVRKMDQARESCGYWASTHDNAMCLCALARYQAMSEGEKPRFEGTVRIPGLKDVAFDHAKPLMLTAKNLRGPVEIATSGAGTVYVAVTAEGFSAKGAAEPYDHNLIVRRQWKDRDGNAVDPAKLHVGQLVMVETSIQTAGLNGTVQNVAIVDALPGGMEVENPRLSTSAGQGDQAVADNAQFLDDRVVLFGPAGGGQKTYRYALRAISAGSFALPPVQASCMYDPGIACVHGGGRRVVIADTPAAKPTTAPATKAVNARTND